MPATGWLRTGGIALRALAFRFHPRLLTLGGVVISVGTGLVGFTSDLALPGAILFAVGLVLTLLGLFTVEPRSVIVHGQWSLDRIKEALHRAPPDATIQILQTWIPDEEFIDCLRELFIHDDKRFDLRVLLLGADKSADADDLLAARVRLRDTGRDTGAQEIHLTLQRLTRLKRTVDLAWKEAAGRRAKTPTLDMEIRLYDFLPFGPIYCIGDDVMFVGFYINYDTSNAAPMLEVRRTPNSRVWRTFERNFDEGWEHSKQFYPPLPAASEAQS